MIRVAVIGAGYWGPNLLRNFAECPDTTIVAVCDTDEQRLHEMTVRYPTLTPLRDFREVMVRDDVDAVAVATPISSHTEIGIAALNAGKHLLMEKPLASSVAEAEQLIGLANRNNLQLMVDHTYVYSPAVETIKQIVDSGELGELYYIDSVRINLGLFQSDVNVVWDLAPHDLSIVDYVLGLVPQSLSAFGTCHADGGHEIEDVAHLHLDYGGGLMTSCHVNWLSPVKIRHFILGGSKKSIVYNDLDPTEKVKVYDRRITIRRDREQRRGMLIDYRIGDVHSPHIDQTEPLQNMVQHFVQCLRHRRTPLTDGPSGLRMVRILEAAQASMKMRGSRVNL